MSDLATCFTQYNTTNRIGNEEGGERRQRVISSVLPMKKLPLPRFLIVLTHRLIRP